MQTKRISVFISPLISLALIALLTACSPPHEHKPKTQAELNFEWLVTSEEAQTWARVKNDNLPAMTGSVEWQAYLAFLEEKLKQYGAVDVFRNSWEFERWDTTDDNAGWSLVSDGKPVRVAHYGAYSGSTDADGITAELVYYDHGNPPDSIEGKIVVIPTMPHPDPPYDQDYLINYTFNDYEYATDAETLSTPFEFVDPAVSFTFDIWWQLAQGLDQIAKNGGAAGAIIVYDMAYERTRELYTFPVPELYDAPTLKLSREDGAQVIIDARAGKTATLRLEATLTPAEAYQLIAYLPGKDYGTPADEQIVLVNHSDGPSITQDNGALGILAIVKYFSNMPQEERQRTLVVYLDCRHYMPGMERAFNDESWLHRHPEAKSKIVAMVQAEHLGEMDFREVDGIVEPVGLAEQSYLWSRDNDILIEAAIGAVKKHGWSRAQVSVPGRPGKNGGLQQVWWGVGAIGQSGDPESQRCQVWHCLDVPGYGLGGFLGYYWTVDADIDRWNGELFRSQAATMTELTGVLMTSDLDAIAPRQVEPGRFLRQPMSDHNGAFRSEALLTMTTLSSRALIPAILDQQIDLSTPVIGATIDVDLAKAFSAPAEELEKLTQQLYTALIDHLVVFLENQSISPQQQVTLAKQFGSLDLPHPLYQKLAEHPEIVELENDGDRPPDTNDWHTDLTFRSNPPFMSILYAKEVPITGGDTLWANMYAAYDALPQAMKSMLHELSAIHDMGTFRNDYLGETMDTNAVNEAMRELGSAVHPITPVHPVTGKRFLYVNRSFTQHIVGMIKAESDRTLSYLYDHINQPEFQVRYRWRAGSMVLWDNRVTQHYAIADYLPHYRRMHRVTVVDDARI